MSFQKDSARKTGPGARFRGGLWWDIQRELSYGTGGVKSIARAKADVVRKDTDNSKDSPPKRQVRQERPIYRSDKNIQNRFLVTSCFDRSSGRTIFLPIFYTVRLAMYSARALSGSARRPRGFKAKTAWSVSRRISFLEASKPTAAG